MHLQMYKCTYFFLNATRKCDIGQLFSFHNPKCNVAVSGDCSIKLDIFGADGFEPLVLTFIVSEACPSSKLFLLKKNENNFKQMQNIHSHTYFLQSHKLDRVIRIHNSQF